MTLLCFSRTVSRRLHSSLHSLMACLRWPLEMTSHTRGKFSFDKNHHPIQDIYVREVIKEGKTLTNKIVSVGLKDHSNAYVSDCKM